MRMPVFAGIAIDNLLRSAYERVLGIGSAVLGEKNL